MLHGSLQRHCCALPHFDRFFTSFAPDQFPFLHPPRICFIIGEAIAQLNSIVIDDPAIVSMPQRAMATQR
jgi:hypothetical protein